MSSPQPMDFAQSELGDAVHAETIQAMTPSELRTLVDKNVRIKCTKYKDEVEGIVYTVDPVSFSFILASIGATANGRSSLTVVPGHSLEHVIVRGECSSEQKRLLTEAFGNFINSNMSCSAESGGNRKERLVDWFGKNRIPCQLSGENSELLQVTDALFIEPPYQPENCLSRNEIILSKVQALIRSMPD